MIETDRRQEDFEEHRAHLRAMAYRMLGSLSEADDAVQEAWLRFDRSDTGGVENLGGWLTTVVARLCLNMLSLRKSRIEEPLDLRMPDPVVSPEDATNPEHEALLGESVGLAIQVILETLAPAERLAFVLHDLFGVPFDEIAPIVYRTPAAARKLASRARRRVRDAPVPDTDQVRQREVVGAFFAAARDGEFEELLAVLDPDVVVRSSGGASRPRLSFVAHGATAVAEQALSFARLSPFVEPVLVNGTAGVIVAPHGRPFAVMGFTVRGGKIASIEVLADPGRLRQLELAIASAIGG